MRIKVESAGKIFATHKQNVVKYDLDITQLDDTAYENDELFRSGKGGVRGFV